MDSTIFVFAFGLFFPLYGLRAIIRKETTFRLGSGRGIPITLTGIPAVIAGVFVLIGGIVMLAPILIALATDSVAANDRIINIAGVVGFVTVIFGFAVGSIYQAAFNVGEFLHKKEKRKRE